MLFGERELKVVQALLFFLFLVLTIVLVHITSSLYRPTGVSAEIVVEKGETARQLVRELVKKGITKHPRLVLLYMKLAGWDKRLRPARIVTKETESVADIIERLVKYVPLVKVVVYEGMDSYEIAHRLQSLNVTSEKNFLDALKALSPKDFGLFGSSMEGYLFPDTYFFSKGTRPEVVVKAMVENFKRKAVPLLLKSHILPPYKTLIVASMVQKETYVPEEMPLVASVIYNRLKRGMPLQIDPTVIYAERKKLNRLTDPLINHRDLKIDSPYNTYLRTGLPPTPICNPGLDAIRAAVFPAKTGYLYFVSEGNGRHYFSKSLKEHLKAVRRFLKAK